MNIRIYTDGACSGNPGKGGWAYIAIDDNDNELFRASGAENLTTNNRMELQAVIMSLNNLLDCKLTEKIDLTIFTDSQYVQQGITNWIFNWKKNNWINSSKQPVKNKDLWVKLDNIASKFNPQWKWLKGHAGNKYNEICDQMAVTAINKS